MRNKEKDKSGYPTESDILLGYAMRPEPVPPLQKHTFFGKKWDFEESMQVAKIVEECVE